MMRDGGPLSAVFVIDRSRLGRAMMEAWLGGEHRIAAVVAMAGQPRRKRSRVELHARRLLGLLPFWQELERRSVPLLEIREPDDWDGLVPTLAAPGADILICFGFPRKIPERVLALFPQGGVNIHPALLPHYRGPYPVHRMLHDNAQAMRGGVTLHRMNGAFDAGEILAQIRFRDEDWASLAAFQNAMSGALAQLAVEAVPKVVAGALPGRPQGGGSFPWASMPAPLIVSARWNTDYLHRMCVFLLNRPGVAVKVDGRDVRLAPPVRRIGPATGEPPGATSRSVRFDVADGRVAARIHSKTSLRLARLRARLERATRRTRRFIVHYPDEP